MSAAPTSAAPTSAPPMSAARPRRVWTFLAIALACAMTALSFAFVPLYSMFCKATGYAGATRVAAKAPSHVVDTLMEVRFDTNVAPGAPLEFTSDQRTRTVKLGETALVFFRVRNTGTRTIHASATYNVTPYKAGEYFEKLECFCFKPHDFAPGATTELPVVFFVDPRIGEDRDTKDLSQITLSYTYFEAPQTGGAVKTADAGPGRDVATR
jgi:cytochrome c oxidase assembly protein subunit 11